MKQTLKEQIQDILYESNVTKPARVALATPHNVEVCEIECEKAEDGLIALFKSWALKIIGEDEDENSDLYPVVKWNDLLKRNKFRIKLRQRIEEND